jgi:hypothetical protein
LTTGINDTGGKFATGVNDTGGKIAAGINDKHLNYIHFCKLYRFGKNFPSNMAAL